MGKWNRNGEGYADTTAGIAIGRVSKDERKIAMAKKRNCRRTTDESIIHEKVVRMRKMTDRQLVNYVDEMVKKARSESLNQGKEQKKEASRLSAEDFVEEIGRIKGIGTATMYKIRELLNNRLEGNADA
ncbi:hypothetical protein [Parablautia intestinalis]|nr:hypothetical protein [Parablautia intestinalis]